MASEVEAPEFSSLFERLLRNREFNLFLSSISRLSDDDDDNPDQETTPQRSRMVIVNPFTQSMVVIEGASSLEALTGGFAVKEGQPPASKASIEAMPSVEIGEGEDGECVVCLEEWKPEETVKEMPCKHKFHDECIEKWLKIHGSCPVCRHKMPVDEEEVGKKRDEERQIWVRFSLGRMNGENNQAPSVDSDNVSSSPDEQQSNL